MMSPRSRLAASTMGRCRPSRFEGVFGLVTSCCADTFDVFKFRAYSNSSRGESLSFELSILIFPELIESTSLLWSAPCGGALDKV